MSFLCENGGVVGVVGGFPQDLASSVDGGEPAVACRIGRLGRSAGSIKTTRPRWGFLGFRGREFSHERRFRFAGRDERHLRGDLVLDRPDHGYPAFVSFAGACNDAPRFSLDPIRSAPRGNASYGAKCLLLRILDRQAASS